MPERETAKPAAGASRNPALDEIERLEATVAELRQQSPDQAVPEGARKLVAALSELAQAQKAALTAATRDAGELRADIERSQRRMALTVHDLKAPITVSLLNLELVEMEGDPTEQMYYLSGVRRELEFMLDTIGNLLELQRDAAAAEPPREPVDLRRTVESVMERMRVLIRDKPGLELVNAIPERLPRVHGQPNRLSRVFSNLLSNAIKYTETGRIEVRAEHQPRLIHIEVADTGMGIHPERIPGLFDYYSGDDQRAESTGVGLAFVRHVVERHGGRVWIESERGEWTVVHLELVAG